ncbi:MAG: hypothetical protein M1269_00145 [Chloroflexi bacterium]|nr:hypothetical protein [Chloroflexota bacterium]
MKIKKLIAYSSGIAVIAIIFILLFNLGKNIITTGRETPEPEIEIRLDCPVQSLARSSEGTLAAGGADGTIRLYDEKSGKLITGGRSAGDDIMAISFSRDGKRVAAGSWQGEISIFDAGSLKTIARTGGEVCRPLRSLSFSPDGKTVLAGDEQGMLSVFDAGTGRLLKKMPVQKDWVNKINFSNDGKYFLTSSCDDTATLWRSSDFSMVRSHNCGSDVLNVLFSPDGKTFACGTERAAVPIWETSTGRKIANLRNHTANVRHLAFSADGRFLASGGADTFVVVWDLKKNNRPFRIPGGMKDVTGLVFLPGGRLAVSSADDTVKIWDLVELMEGEKPVKFTGGDADLTIFDYALVFSPDGKTVATGAGSGIIRLWKTEDGSFIRELRGHDKAVFALDWDPITGRLLSASEDCTVGIWDPKSGRREKTIEAGRKAMVGIESSPGGKHFVTGSRDNTVRLWKDDGTLLNTFTGYKDNVHVLKFVPEKRMLLTVDETGKVIIWDFAAGKKIAEYDVGRQVLSGDLHVFNNSGPAAGRDGSIVFAFNKKPHNRVYLSDPEKGLITAELKGHPGEVTAVAYSSKGMLASGDYKGVILLWEDNKQAKKLICPGGKIQNLDFSPDGSVLASGTYDGRVILWDTKTGRIKAVIKG